MSAEMDKKRFGFAATVRTLGYALGIIVRHQPLYLVFLLGAGLCKGLMPFIAVLLPKLVLEELSGGKDPARLLLLVLAAAGLSGLLYWLGGLMQLRRDRENDKFDKLMKKFEELEKREAEREKSEKIAKLRKELKAKLKKEGVDDAEWLDGYLKKLTITEETDIDEEKEDALKLYNKANSTTNQFTPGNPAGKGGEVDLSYLKKGKK